MGVYYLMIIITISKKRILIDWIFHFRRCQITLLRNEMEPFDRAWFGCCPSGRIPSDNYGNPTCSSNDVTRSAALGLPKQQVVENQMRTHAQNGDNARLLKPHGLTTFARRGHVSSMFWLGFSWTDGRVKIDHWPKRTYADTRLSKYTMEPVLHQQTILWIHGTMWVPWCNGPYHWMCFKC